MFLVKCPKCKHDMKVQPPKNISTARKVCVYCGKSFKVNDRIIKQIKST